MRKKITTMNQAKNVEQKDPTKKDRERNNYTAFLV